MWSLLGIAVATLLWATLGKVDIVAVAQGKIIPSDRTKVIQPVGTATIKAIFVQEGDTVAAGDILVELDDVAAKADIARISNEIAALSIEANRAQAMLDAIQTNTAPTVARPDDAPLTAWQDAQNLTRGEFATHAAKLRAIDAEIPAQGGMDIGPGPGQEAGGDPPHCQATGRVLAGTGARAVCPQERLSRARTAAP